MTEATKAMLEDARGCLEWTARARNACQAVIWAQSSTRCSAIVARWAAEDYA